MKKFRDKIGMLLQLLIVIGVAVITMVIMFHGDEAHRIIRHLKHAKKGWIILAAASMIFFVFVESVQLKVMFTGMKQKITLWKCFLLSNVEYFFAQITPGASGGQPIQMVYMSRLGVDVLVGALACMMVAVLYKAAFLTIFIAALIFRTDLVLGSISRVPILFSIGVIFQLISITVILLCIFRPSIASAAVNGIINIGAKLHIVKHPSQTRTKADNSIAMYREGSAFLKNNKWVIFRLFLYTIAQRLAFFSVTFFVAKALGVHHVDWFSVVSVQAILSLSVDMLPIPGAAGANEAVFVNLQRKLFHESMMGAGLLLNRGITYYFLLISCGIFTIFANILAGKKKKKELIAEENAVQTVPDIRTEAGAPTEELNNNPAEPDPDPYNRE